MNSKYYHIWPPNSVAQYKVGMEKVLIEVQK